MPTYSDLEEAIALEDAISEEPEIAFDDVIKRLGGVLADYKGNGEMMAYMRHTRRHAIEAMLGLASVDPKDATQIIALQSRIGDYLRLCSYMADVLSNARALKFGDDVDVGGAGVVNGEEGSGARQRRKRIARPGNLGDANGTGGNRRA